MKAPENFFKEARKDIDEFIQNNLLLLKLQAVEKISKLVAVVAAGLLVILFCFFILFFLSILGGYYFTDLTGSTYLGFGIIAAFYILLLTLMIVFRKKLVDQFIVNTVINIFFEAKKENTRHES
ncbi:MAG TPA: hypothetical protein PKM63_19435 [Panacibacter sp.]|nr:hypothetical protein [Panacibacter sp.]HNP46477.1 hypothetical protein [Panacibacter sp.]